MDYTAKFERAIDAGIRAGFLLKSDAASLRAEGARVGPDAPVAATIDGTAQGSP